MNETQIFSLEQAFCCSLETYPDCGQLPCSFFDRTRVAVDRMVEFRTVLFYSGNGPFPLRFTGGCRFRLLINGVFAEDGPVEIGGDYGKKDAPDWWFFDEKEISCFLHAGENELLFQMIPAGMTQMDYSLGFLWLWCAVLNKGNWQALPAEKWQSRLNPFYRKCTLQDFRQPESVWRNDCRSVAVPVPVRHLGLPPLVSLLREDFVLRFPFGKSGNTRAGKKKVSIVSGDPVSFFLEFPEERCGHFELLWEGGHECLAELEFQELYGIPQGTPEKVYVPAHCGAYRTIRCYAFRYVRITLTPSFFAGENNAETVSFSFRMYERHFPVPRKIPLRKVPPLFREIDRLCLRNIVMCMQRMHLDSPIHQEGLGCTGDYRIEALAEYAAFRESRLARADLLRSALLLRQQGKLFHTSYELCYIFMFEEYVQFTGDRTLLTECYDVLQQIYRRFHGFTGAAGLLSEAENYLFIDWIVEGVYTWHHPPAHRGTGVMTALWYGALQALAKLAQRLDREKDQTCYLAEAARVRQAFNRELWDEKRGCYRDGIPGMSRRGKSAWLPEEDCHESASSLTSVMALACGLPTEKEEPEKLLRRVVAGELPLRPTVYFMFYLCEGVCRYGKWAEYGPSLISQWSVFLKTGLRESWTAGDYSHGWGAAPSIFLRRKEFGAHVKV